MRVVSVPPPLFSTISVERWTPGIFHCLIPDAELLWWWCCVFFLKCTFLSPLHSSLLRCFSEPSLTFLSEEQIALVFSEWTLNNSICYTHTYINMLMPQSENSKINWKDTFMQKKSKKYILNHMTLCEPFWWKMKLKLASKTLPKLFHTCILLY